MDERATLPELAALRARVAALEAAQVPHRGRGRRLPRARWLGAALVLLLARMCQESGTGW
jgi:hypothetical protein